MYPSIITRAQDIAQEHMLRIFPVDENKRPILSGWQHRASNDPAEIEEMFSAPNAAGIGVPCGPDNDLYVFDLDYGHDPTPQQKDRMDAWVEQWSESIENDCRIHRTPSGGLHYIYAWPTAQKPARRIMGKIDGITNGFYFVWYDDHVSGEIKAEPPAAMYRQVHSDEIGGDGSALMESGEAHEVMLTNGDAGMRHDALLRFTQDFADDNPTLSTQQKCALFEDAFRREYGDYVQADRLDVLLEWQEERGELWRAMSGARDNRDAGALLAEIITAKNKEQAEKVAAFVAETEALVAAQSETLFTKYVEGEIPPSAPWLLEGLLRERGNFGITGMSGVGKTCVSATWVCGMISGRSDAVGLPPVARPLNVAWMNAEEESADLLEHVDVACKVHGLPDIGTLLVVGEDALDKYDHGLSLVIMGQPAGGGSRDAMLNMPLIDTIVDALLESKIDVLIADPITEFNDGNENDRGHAKILNRAFKLISQRAECAVIYWAHTGQPAEGKGPAWYRNDLYAQRGSSQNVGSLKTAATHWHMVPSGRASEQWDHVKKAKNAAFPDTPNLTAITVVKVKKYATQWAMAYEITSSRVNADVPVAIPHTMEEAELRMEKATSGNAEFMMVKMTRDIIEKMGVGTHTTRDVERMMKGANGWPTTERLRVKTKSTADFLDQWRRGERCVVDGNTHLVVSERDGLDGFRFVISLV